MSVERNLSFAIVFCYLAAAACGYAGFGVGEDLQWGAGEIYLAMIPAFPWGNYVAPSRRKWNIINVGICMAFSVGYASSIPYAYHPFYLDIMQNQLLLSACVLTGIMAILCCALMGVIIKSLDVSGTAGNGQVAHTSADPSVDASEDAKL